VTTHAEILSDPQRALLAVFGPTASRYGFYLAGGTALALRLGHRRSDDFDWFSASPVEDSLALAGMIHTHLPSFVVRSYTEGTLHGESDGIRLSFLGYRYPTLEESEWMPEYGCRIASIPDIACMKLSAIAQRGAKRDFVDLYALLSEGVTLSGMVGDYLRKFSIADPGSALIGLSYFDDAEMEPMPTLFRDWTWNGIKSGIGRALAEYLSDTGPR
jgi:hypothetical protein